MSNFELQHGDALYVPFQIKVGETIITNRNVSGVRIAIGRSFSSWPNGRLKYRNQSWFVPVSQQNSYQMDSSVKVQAQVQFSDGTTLGSRIENLCVHPSVFNTIWGEPLSGDGFNQQVQEIVIPALSGEIELSMHQAQISSSDSDDSPPSALPFIDLRYTRRSKNKWPVTRLVIGIHNCEYREGMYIQCYQMNRREKRKRWIKGCRGYASICSETIKHDSGVQYPNPPAWMPNSGIPIERWDVTEEMFGNTREYPGHYNGVEIDLKKWLLDFMKPLNYNDLISDGEDAYYDSDYDSCFVGVEKYKLQYLKFRFELCDNNDNMIGQSISSLCVGIRKECGITPNEMMSDPVSSLYVSIR